MEHCKHPLRPVTVLLPGRKEAGLWRRKSLVTQLQWICKFQEKLVPSASRKVSKNTSGEDVLKVNCFVSWLWLGVSMSFSAFPACIPRICYEL